MSIYKKGPDVIGPRLGYVSDYLLTLRTKERLHYVIRTDYKLANGLSESLLLSPERLASKPDSGPAGADSAARIWAASASIESSLAASSSAANATFEFAIRACAPD